MLLLLLLIGCSPTYTIPGPLASLGLEPAPTRSVRRASDPAEAPAASPNAIAAAAAGFVGARALVVGGESYRWDCSGLVEAALAAGGCAHAGSTADLFRQAREERVLHRRRLPAPGDVAFFDDTYDRDGNGRRDDPLSHVAVVESVAGDGTIQLVHVGSRGVTRFVMNLRWPDERADAQGQPLNDPLRNRTPKDSPRTRYLAGELWVAFGTFAV